jgi:hypothetical protein
MTHRRLPPLLLAALAVPLAAGPALAGADPAPLVAGYWAEFLDHWATVFQRQNGIVMGTIGFGALCLFIITRGKWKKS